MGERTLQIENNNRMGLQRVYDQKAKIYYHLQKENPLPKDEYIKLSELTKHCIKHFVNIIDVKSERYQFTLM